MKPTRFVLILLFLSEEELALTNVATFFVTANLNKFSSSYLPKLLVIHLKLFCCQLDDKARSLTTLRAGSEPHIIKQQMNLDFHLMIFTMSSSDYVELTFLQDELVVPSR